MVIVDADLMNGRACFIQRRTENVQVVGQEKGYERCGDVQSWCKDDSNVSNCHLVRLSVVHDLNQERRQVAEELKVGNGELVHKHIEALNLLAALVHVYGC